MTAVAPVAWWLWAIGLATVAARTTNPLLLLIILAVAGVVVTACRPVAPWANSYTVFLRIAVIVVAIRVGFAVAFGEAIGTHVMFTLPNIDLPDWAAGVRLGGPVTLESLLTAFGFGLSLATVLVCFAAASSLASPSRLLASLPAALYEIGLTVVVALTYIPQLIADVSRVRTAAYLRGRSVRGPRGVSIVATPVLEGSLERALELAAALESRGYGRSAATSVLMQRTTAGLLLGALVGVCLGLFGLLSNSGRYALPLLGVGIAAAIAGLRLGGRRSIRTRYRSARWQGRDTIVAASGLVSAAVGMAVVFVDPGVLTTVWVPLAWPDLPLATSATALVGLVPVLLARTGPSPVPVGVDERVTVAA